MRSVVSSTWLPVPRHEVFAYLDVLVNHERFTNHVMTDWIVDGPARGVGARARLTLRAPGRSVRLALEVVAATLGEMIVEETRDESGSRHNRGSYRLTDHGTGTRVRFELEALAMPWYERPLAPLALRWVQRANDRALVRLGEVLAHREPRP